MGDYNKPSGSYNKPGGQGRPAYQGGNNNRNFEAPPAIAFPDGYLSNGYNNKDGKRELKYITQYPQQISKFLVGFKEETAYSKMRSYYDEVVSIKEAYCAKRMDMCNAASKLAMLEKRAINSTEKKNMHNSFKQFICKNVEYVISVEDEMKFKVALNNFADHFEAVICLVYKGKQK